MNPLQEYPELFANGKFRVRWFFKDEPYDDYLIEGYTLDEGGALMIEGTDGSKHNYIFPKSEKMKLIARPIEDMTDEEIWGWLEAWKGGSAEEYKQFGFELEEIRERIINACDNDTLTRDQFLYLLSIGVLPFPQTLFEDRTVIDSREVL